jgi:hypothetical protein
MAWVELGDFHKLGDCLVVLHRCRKRKAGMHLQIGTKPFNKMKFIFCIPMGVSPNNFVGKEIGNKETSAGGLATDFSLRCRSKKHVYLRFRSRLAIDLLIFHQFSNAFLPARRAVVRFRTSAIKGQRVGL